MKRNVASPESRSRPATSPYVLKLVLYSIVYSCSRPSYRQLQWRTWIMVTALALASTPDPYIGPVDCYRLDSPRASRHTRGGKASELASRVRNRDRLRLAARRTAARPSILVIADSSRPTTHRVSRRLAPCDSRDAAVSTISISRPPNDSTNTHEAPGGKRRARRQCGPFTLPTRAPALVPRRAHLGALDLVLEAISTVEPLNRVISSSSKRATH